MSGIDPTMTPDVSVVLITYNDAQRLPRALASLQDQTLASLEIVVVDDCSTDETPSIVEAAMARDARVRLVRLPENSGGCSTPRNAGIEAAQAPWVMFCDSDDVMERHACKTLLLAAEAANADVACGVVERVDVHSGEANRWHAELHEPAVLGSIDERPELIADTVSVNKLYRRAFLDEQGIRFPEGILYEDQAFTFEALGLARGIAVVSDTVYFWSVDGLAEERSITQRKADVRNVRDRVAVNRIIDEAIERRGLQRLRPVKDRKFLRHDLHVHLSTILDLDDETAGAVIAELAPYCRTVDPDAASAIRPALRVALLHLLLGDLGHLRSAMRNIRWSAVVDARITAMDGREIWACGHERGDAVLGRPRQWWLDVTDLRILRAPVSAIRPCHRLSSLGPSLVATGVSVDVTGLGQPDEAWLVLAAGERIILRSPVAVSCVDETWHWASTGAWSAAVPDAAASAHRGMLALALRFGDDVILQQVRASDVPPISATVAGIPIRTGTGERATITWARTKRRAANRLGREARRYASAVARRLQARHDIVLWSLDGRGASDAMLELAAQLPEATWVWERNPELAPTGSLDAASIAGGRLLGRASVVVVDAGLPVGIRPDARVVRLQSDIPVTRAGHDAPDWDLTPVKARIPEEMRRWNVMALPSDESCARVADAIEFTGIRLVVGSLRGQRAASLDRASARRRIGLRDDRAVVLWAPVALDPVDPQAELERDLTALVDALGDDAFVLLRARRRAHVPAVLRSSARDVSLDGDAAGILAAADVLITDASPLLMDAVRLGTPVVAWSRRFDAIDRSSGLSIDLAAASVVTTSLAGCVDAVRMALAGADVRPDEAILDLAGNAGGAAALADAIRSMAGSR